MPDYASYNNLADEASARAAGDAALDTRVTTLENAPSGGLDFSLVDFEPITLNANNEYTLAAAPAGIVANHTPLVVVGGVVQDGVTAAKTYEVLNDAGGLKRKLRMYPIPRAFTTLGDSKLALPPGQATTALLLDGYGDYALSAASPNFAMGQGDFTAECWFRPTVINYYHSIFGTRTSSASVDTMWNIGLDSGGAVYFYTTYFGVVSPAGFVTINNWHHVAVTRSGTVLKLYVNGALISSGTNNQNFTESRLHVGAQGNGQEPFAGYIRDVRVTKGVVRYTENFTPPASPLPSTGDPHLSSVVLQASFNGRSGSNNLTYISGAEGPLQNAEAFISYRAANA